MKNLIKVLIFVGISNLWAGSNMVVINNLSNTDDLLDYQVLITILPDSFDYSQATSDGRDVRIIDPENGDTLPYWIERWVPGDTSLIWVKVPHIPANGIKILNLTYGDPNLQSESNGYVVFEFFEDFESGQLDTAKWRIESSGNGSGYVVYDSTRQSFALEVLSYDNLRVTKAIASFRESTGKPLQLIYKIRYKGGTDGGVIISKSTESWVRWWEPYTPAKFGARYGCSNGVNNAVGLFKGTQLNGETVLYHNLNISEWQSFKISSWGDSIELISRNDTIRSVSLDFPQNDSFNFVILGVKKDNWANPYNGDWLFDDIIVRKYSRPDPEVVVCYSEPYIAVLEPKSHELTVLENQQQRFSAILLSSNGLSYAKWFLDDSLIQTQQLHGDEDTITLEIYFHGTGTKVVKLIAFDSRGDSTFSLWNVTIIEPLQTGLVAYWSFDDCTAADNSGNGHDGIVHGNPTCVPGAVGNAFHFDGEHDYIELNEFPEDFSHGITVSAWVIFEEPRYWGRIIELGNGAANDNILFAQHKETNNLCFEVYRPGSPLNSHTQKVEVFNGIVRNQLMHVVARGTPGDDGFLHVDIFINGERMPTFNVDGEPSDITNIPRPITRTNNYIALSSWSIDELFNGLLDEIRVYNRPLTDEEIQMLYRQVRYSSDLTPTDLVVEHQNDGLLITATVANHGDTARNIPVRFMVEDLTAGTGELLTIADSVIDELDPGQSTTVSTFWTPQFPSYTLYVSVDPDNIIPETNEENNIISETFRERGPIVQAVVAEYDGDPDEDIFGRYISGVELINRFTAQVTDPDSANDVARVMFIFEDDTLVDDDPSDGWSVEYDVGQLPHVVPLKVVAYDLSGTPSEPVTYTVNTAPMPHWLQVYMQDFGCDFYFDYDAGVYRTGEQYFPIDLNGDYFIPSDVLLLGRLETRIAAGALLNASVPLERGGDPIPFNPDFGGDIVILGNEIFSGNIYEILEELGREHYVVVTGYLDPWSLEFDQIEFHMNQPFEFDPFVLPEVHQDLNVLVHGIPVTVGVDFGGEVRPRIDDVGAFINSSFTFDSLFIDPAVEILVDLSAKVEVAFGVASVAMVAHPTADIESRLLYPPPGFHLSGAFVVPFELVGSLGWGWISGTLYQDTLGPWAFGTEGERILAERMPILLARLDSLNLPDILPNPYMATDDSGHAMVVWIHDNDPTPGRADPDVYYAVWDGTSWGTAQPIESGSNDRFELDPVVAFMPNGDAIAVWSANTAPGYVKDLNAIFRTQDIYYSVWNHTTGEWSDVQPLISDSLPDGLASVAVGPQGQVLVAWNKILSDSISDRRSWAVYYTYWDGTHWSEPAPIPGTDVDNGADCMVKVAYSPDGTAIAVWLYDGDGDFTTTFDTDLKYAIWDGHSWSSAEMLTSTAQEAEQNASVVFDSLGRAIVVWTAKDSTIDRLYFSMMDTTGDWSTPELIYETPQFAYQPIVQVTNQGIVMVFWRGYQGYDGDLFYTMKDLRSGSGWIQPRALTDDSLTDWLATMAIDANNNALYIWSKWNWSGSQPSMAEDGMYFADGLFFAGKGIKSDMSLGDLNMGAHPILPDLVVSSSSMTVSERFASPGDTVTVGAVVWNGGDVASDTVTVRFTYGHPDSGGMLIEPEFRIALGPDSAETLTVQWVVQEGINRIYVVVDPEDVENELSESNNIASIDCYAVADLAVDSADISFDNPNPLVGDTVIVTVAVHNIGPVASDSVLVAFYEGNPNDSASVLLDTVRLGSIAPDGYLEAETRLAATYGEHRIFVVIDPDDEQLEPDESNNMAFARLKVLPDLMVNEIDFDTTGFDTVGLIAVVANDGGVSAGAFTMAFYDGDPMLGGELIDSVVLDSMSAFSEDTVSIPWSPTPGQHEVFVVVDIDDSVMERNEFNNRLSASIFVHGRPDLTISPDEIEVSDDHPHSGDTITITAWVRNNGLANALAAFVRLYLVDGDTSLIDGVVLPVVEAGDSAEAQFDWIIPDDFTGTARLMVYADPNDSIPESDESNNSAMTRVFVNTPEIVALPEQFDVVVDSAVTVSETLIVRNTGSADLIFNIAVDYSEKSHLDALLDGAKPDTGWLYVSIACDTVPEDDSTMVEIAMSSAGLSFGYHLATLEIESNDSANPMVEVPVSFGLRPPAPELISPINSVFVTDSMPTFVWSIDSGFDGTFVLQIALDSAFTSNLIEISNISDTSYTLEQPLADTVYWWRVKAVTSDGLEGDFSEAGMFVVDAHAPSVPALVAPVGGIWLSDTALQLQWSSVTLNNKGKFYGRMAVSALGRKPGISHGSGAGVLSVGREFELGAKPTPVYYVVEILSGGSTVLIDTVDTNAMAVELSEGRYEWHVMAFDEAGNASDWSPIDSFGIDITPPSVDSMTVLSDTSWFFGPFDVDAWISDNLSGVGSAWLFWSVDGSPFDSVAMSLSGGVWSGEIPALGDSANYTVSYFVRAADNAEPANVTTSDTVGFTATLIEEARGQIPSEFELLGVAQNPVRGSVIGLKLAIPSTCDAKFAIYDIAGRRIWQTTRNLEAGYHDVNLRAELRSGVYFIMVSTPFGKANTKVIISR